MAEGLFACRERKSNADPDFTYHSELPDTKPWLALQGRGAFPGYPFVTVVDESEIEVLR